MIGIYTITNSINGKIYVGYSKNIKSRLYKHKYELRNNTPYMYLTDYMNKEQETLLPF